MLLVAVDIRLSLENLQCRQIMSLFVPASARILEKLLSPLPGDDQEEQDPESSARDQGYAQ